MKTYGCERCGYVSVQPDGITGMWHDCQPPGRPLKRDHPLRLGEVTPKAAA